MIRFLAYAVVPAGDTYPRTYFRRCDEADDYLRSLETGGAVLECVSEVPTLSQLPEHDLRTLIDFVVAAANGRFPHLTARIIGARRAPIHDAPTPQVGHLHPVPEPDDLPTTRRQSVAPPRTMQGMGAVRPDSDTLRKDRTR